ncbi:beta-ketoacyl synthase N-terminal-like domain-containing protein [Labedaea rhizosphaerae]|uniref:Ketoacyl-synthetase-like protein n=1 Tax=Labedaea rhizosphaerae TaxID=598644 RepID=A0A4R6S7I9_LABRH|nr:polyketide synthase [Labedaea rhizosphaerae]TDP95217.1 ketoacyl-synthetase-like protein [Labedaea rhizosphaerae]
MSVDDYEGDEIAVIGIAARVPGAPDAAAFWRNLLDGVDSIRDYTADELRAAGVPESLLSHPDYVRSAGHLDDLDRFDAEFFGYPPEEAALIDPQHRLFLQTAWTVLEDGGYDVTRCDGSVGVFAGAAANQYLLRHLLPGRHSPLGPDGRLAPGHTPDYLPARVSYKLGLTGPSVAVQTACSSSLVAVALAAQALQDFRCDLAIAGGVAVTATTPSGYLATEAGVLSRDGRCRSFDADASGSAPAGGAGAVLLKRLADAQEDGDHVYAVLRGWAVTNEGAGRAGFLTPGVDGQAAAVTEALAAAELAPETLGFLEISGGGTAVGDAMEVAGLHRAFAAAGGEPTHCVLGCVKANVGNLDAASGIAGLIKAVLAVHTGTIPANPNFAVRNPEIDFTQGGFSVAEKTAPWPEVHAIRRAGVTAISMNGTNAHVVVEEPPPRPIVESDGTRCELVVSARTPELVTVAARRLADHLRAHPDLALADVAYTLGVGRRAFGYHAIVDAATLSEACSALDGELAIERAEPELVPGAGRRVPLPGYPFAGERHWVEPPREGGADRPNGRNE